MVETTSTNVDWRRVAVVGSSGSGKSTLAQQLARRLDCEHVRLDDLAFGPNWSLRPEAEMRTDVERLAAGDRWVIDGNYRHLRDVVWRRATTLVWLDLPLATCLRRVLLRTVRRSLTGQRVCNGNRESLYKAFATRDSILRWVIQSHADVRRTVGEDLASSEYNHLTVHRLSRPAEVKRLLAEQTA